MPAIASMSSTSSVRTAVPGRFFGAAIVAAASGTPWPRAPGSRASASHVLCVAPTRPTSATSCRVHRVSVVRVGAIPVRTDANGATGDASPAMVRVASATSAWPPDRGQRVHILGYTAVVPPRRRTVSGAPGGGLTHHGGGPRRSVGADTSGVLRALVLGCGWATMRHACLGPRCSRHRLGLSCPPRADGWRSRHARPTREGPCTSMPHTTVCPSSRRRP